MQLESAFSVVAPIEKVWDTLMDFEQVAGCVPGAQVLNKLSDDSYQVGMKVKLGPATMQYKGQMNVVERDATKHRAVLQGRAKEARGQGTAEATATLHLVESGGTTKGTVSADLALSGKAAAMGKSVIGSVTDQMMATFAANLQAMLIEPTPAPPDRTSDTVDGHVAAERENAPRRPATAAVEAAPKAAERPSSASASAGRHSAASADTSLDAIALARGMVADQLSSPSKLLGLLALVAFVAYRLGRRTSRRRASS